MRLVINVIRKDWFEFRKTILTLGAGACLPLFFVDRSSDFVKGMMAGLAITAAYSFSYFCFTSERQRGTLRLMLALPLRPSEFVLAKYASLYSMCLFVANVPALYLRDPYLLLLINAFVLFLSTLCMSFTVISDKPWAPVIPMWIVLLFLVRIKSVRELRGC